MKEYLSGNSGDINKANYFSVGNLNYSGQKSNLDTIIPINETQTTFSGMNLDKLFEAKK